MSASRALRVQLDDQGLVTAICQDASTGKVLMVAHMSPESIDRTLSSGEIRPLVRHFY